jgi:hypothetical protein
VIRFHEDPTGFVDALRFTEGETRFSARLVEKDYYCTVLLEYLPLLTPDTSAEAATLLLDPVTGNPRVPPILVRCLSKPEALAEKLRAALTRREAAIRDFYDLDFAVRAELMRADDDLLLGLLRQKLKVPGTGPMNVSDARLAELRVQARSVLQPVLRPEDWGSFDLDRAFRLVSDFAAEVG